MSAGVSSYEVSMWRGRRAEGMLLALLVVLGAVLRVVNLGGVVRRTPDEYTYTNSANTLIEMGTAAGYPVLFANFARDPARPSPTRIGYHALLMATMRLMGDRTPQAGAWLACAASVLSLALLAALGWRFFPTSAAGAATLLYAVSPAELMFSRRCWEESVVELLCLAALGVAFAFTAGSRRAGLYVMFVVIGVLALTVKELSAVAYLLAAGWCVAVLVGRGDRKAAVGMGLATLVAVGLALGWAAVRLGGVAQLSQLSVVGSKVAETSPYGLAYSSGPAWLMLVGIWIGSATTAVLALLGIACLVRTYMAPDAGALWVADRTIVLGLVVVCAVFIGLTMVLPEKLNLRLICPAYGPLALLAGVGFCAVLGVIRRSLPAAEARTMCVVAVMFLMGGAAADYRNFAVNFAAADVQDLSIRMVLESAGRSMPGEGGR